MSTPSADHTGPASPNGHASAPHGAVLRQHAEQQYAEELHELAKVDDRQRPPNWELSPWAVRTYVLGGRLPNGFEVTPKYIGNARLIEIAISTLATDRALLLYGIPGTAKSWLSEHLAAAVAGDSTLLIQGTAGTDESAIRYGWNYARLLTEGPSPAALVVSPMMRAMETGKIARIEELTRIPAEVQDTLITMLSEKTLPIPELNSEVQAVRGFNLIATANDRDRGVNELSSALKRRFNFETVHPIADPELELQLVMRQTQHLLAEAEAEVVVPLDVIDLLVTTFHDLRAGRTQEGMTVERPSTVMSTAEAVSVGVSAGLDACHFGSGRVESEHVVRNLVGTVLKDNPDDAKRLKHYFDVVVKARAQRSEGWKSYYKARKWLQ